jgi:hypothetical protein
MDCEMSVIQRMCLRDSLSIRPLVKVSILSQQGSMETTTPELNEFVMVVPIFSCYLEPLDVG